VNGKLLQGVLSVEVLSREIEGALTAARSALGSGVPRDKLDLHLANKNNKDYARVLLLEKDLLLVEQRKPEGRKPESPQVELYRIPVGVADPARGADLGLVTIVAFLDFSCALSRESEATMQELLRLYPTSLKFVYKPAPRSEDGRHAVFACLAAMEQGRFWEMYQKTIEHPEKAAESDFSKWASDLGLNRDRFISHFRRGEDRYGVQIAQAVALADAAGAQGTPFFFVNGEKVRGAKPLSFFREIIDRHLVKARLALKGGVPRHQIYSEMTQGGRGLERRSVFASERVSIKLAGRPGLGPIGAPIQLVLYSDLISSRTIRFTDSLRAVVRSMKGKSRLTIKPFPAFGGDEAREAARFVWGAHKQGRFWEALTALAKAPPTQRRPNRALAGDGVGPAPFAPRMMKLTELAGLDRASLAVDMRSLETRQSIADDLREGRGAGARIAPTLYVNGRQYLGQDRTARGLVRMIRSRFFRARGGSERSRR
jgi:protein-disulfide isomerase